MMGDPFSMLAMFAISTVASGIISYLFPAEGPRLKDLSVSASTYGNTVPEVWGTVRVGGNMIWSGGIIENKHKAKAGIGQYYNQYTYTANFAMAFCKGPVQSLRRIWANGKLIYDATGNSRNVNNGKYAITFYQGTEDQMPDPIIEAKVGSTNTPAYRGTCYILFRDFLLTDFGNQIPQIAAEIYAGPAAGVPSTPWTVDGTVPFTDIEDASSGMAVDYVRGFFYVVRDDNALVRMRLSDGEIDGFGYPVSAIDNDWTSGKVFTAVGIAYDGSVTCQFGGLTNYTQFGQVDPITFSTLNNMGKAVPFDTLFPSYLKFPLCADVVMDVTGTSYLGLGSFGEVIYIWDWTKPLVTDPGGTTYPPIGNYYTSKCACAGAEANQFYVAACNHEGTITSTSFTVYFMNNGAPVPFVTFADPDIGSGSTDFSIKAVAYDAATNSLIMMYASSLHNYVSKFSLDTNSAVWVTKVPWLPTHGWRGQNFNGNQIAWTANGSLWLIDMNTGLFINRSPDQAAYTDNNWLNHSDVDYSNPGENGYVILTLPAIAGEGHQVYDGTSGALVVLRAGTSGVSLVISANAYGSTAVTLADILTSLMLSAGLSYDQFDVSAGISIAVSGYGFAEQTDIKGIISQLQSIYLFDFFERDGKLVLVMRGGDTSVETISYKALGSPGGSSADTSDFWKESRLSEADIPASMSLKYLNIDQDFEENTATSKRILAPVPTVFSRQQDTVEANLVLDATEAKNRVNAMLYTTWAERTKHATRLPLAYAYLEPSDLITVNLADGRSYFERIERTEMGADYTTEADTLGQDSGTYTFNLTGDGGNGQGQTLQPPLPARAFIFNTPYLRDIDNVGDGNFSIYYTGVGNLAPSGYNGATLFVSLDANSYSILQVFPRDMEWGRVTTATPDAANGCYALDWKTQIIIYPAITSFDLQSVTDDELMLGANMFILGDEVMQFRDAVQNSDGTWTISNLLRGRRGTEWACATHQANESFVFLSTDTMAVSQNGLDAGNKNYWYKAVGTGMDVGTAIVTQITYEPRDLMPYAPCQLDAAWSGADIRLTFQRRTRYGGEMMDGTGTVPLNETKEAYEIDIYDPDTGDVVRTLSVDNGTTPVDFPYVIYSAADVAADFTSELTEITFEVYQLGITGRGFGTKKTITISGTPSPTARYWGASALASLAESDILALSDTDLATTFDNTVTYNCSGSKYFYFCYPATFGTPDHVVVNGLPFSAFSVTTVSVGGTSYNVLRSDTLQSGASIPVTWA